MITNQLLRPASIVVVGASNNVHKPGGAILRNLINGGYTGELRAVNPKETEVQGVTAYADVKDIPDTELAILAIPAQMCPDAVEVLAAEKQVRAFIILSADGITTGNTTVDQPKVALGVKSWISHHDEMRPIS